MRSLTTIEGQSRAEAFVAYLVTLNISTHVEPSPGSSTAWEIWIRDEDKIELARNELNAFLQNPDDTRYLQAVKDARSILRDKREQVSSRQQNVQTSRDIQRNSMFSGSIPGMTLTLIILCCLLSFVSDFSHPKQDNLIGQSIVKQLLFVDMNKYAVNHDPAYSIKQGEVWRLVTPMFLHGDTLHLLMNMLALASLGRLTERLERKPRYFFLVLALAIGAHIPQGMLPENILGIQGLSGSPNFVGISGVVMGLFGYVATKTYLRRDLGFAISSEAYFMIGIVLIYGFAGSIFAKGGGVQMANFAHLGGLLTGIVIGVVLSSPAFDYRRRA